MATMNVESIRADHESFNRRDAEGMIRNQADDFTYADHPRGVTLKGNQQFKDWAVEWTRACTNGQISKPEYIDAGDVVCTLFMAEGTNDGRFAGLPAAGRHMSCMERK